MALTDKQFLERLELSEYIANLSGNKLDALYIIYNNVLKAYKNKDFSDIKRNKAIYEYACNRQIMTGALIKAYSNLLLIVNTYPELGATMQSLGNDKQSIAKARLLYKKLSEILESSISIKDSFNVGLLDEILGSGVSALEEKVDTDDIEADTNDIEESTDDIEDDTDDIEADTDDKKDLNNVSTASVIEERISNLIRDRQRHAKIIIQIATVNNTNEQLHMVIDRFTDDTKRKVTDILGIAYNEKADEVDEGYLKFIVGNMLSSLNLVETLVFKLDTSIRRNFYTKYDRLCAAMHSRKADDKKIVYDNLSAFSTICNKQAVLALIAPITPNKFRDDFSNLYTRIINKDEGSQFKNAKAVANDFDNFIKGYNGQGVDETVTYSGIVSALNSFNDEADETDDEKRVKAEGRIKSLLDTFNSVAIKSKPLITQVVLPAAFSVLCDKVENIRFDEDKQLDTETEDTFMKTMTATLINQLIDNDSLSLRFELEDVAEETKQKHSLSIDENTLERLNEHKQLEYVLSKIFKYNVGDNSAKELGAKVLISIACSSAKYAIKNMKKVESGEE